jgi:hypothetical protein
MDKQVRPKEIMPQLAPVLPLKYSPINQRTGNGNQKAYLAEVSRAAFRLATKGQDDEITPADNDGPLSPFFEFVTTLENRVEKQIERDDSLTATEKEQLIRARRGQGIFRNNVGKIERGCRVTGVTNPRLLVASHIKPWRSCLGSQERLDGHNGLLLTPNVDHLFDRGLISFANNGSVLTSTKLEMSDLKRLGMAPNAFAIASEFAPQQCSYLDYHRSIVFIR